IAAIPVGLVLTIASGLVVVFGFWLGDQIVTPDNAEVGQCVAIEESDDEENTIGLMKAECGDDHDGQMVAGEEITVANQGNGVTAFCETAIEPGLAAAIETEGNLVVKGVMEDPPGDVGDTVVCYVERADGSDLSSKIG